MLTTKYEISIEATNTDHRAAPTHAPVQRLHVDRETLRVLRVTTRIRTGATTSCTCTSGAATTS